MLLILMCLLLTTPNMKKMVKKKVENKHKRRKRGGIILLCNFIHLHCLFNRVLLPPIFRKSLGTIVLDDEDLELIRENRRINQEASVSFCLYSTNSSSV